MCLATVLPSEPLQIQHVCWWTKCTGTTRACTDVVWISGIPQLRVSGITCPLSVSHLLFQIYVGVHINRHNGIFPVTLQYVRTCNEHDYCSYKYNKIYLYIFFVHCLFIYLNFSGIVHYAILDKLFLIPMYTSYIIPIQADVSGLCFIIIIIYYYRLGILSY